MKRRVVESNGDNNGVVGIKTSGRSMARLKRLDIYTRPKEEFQRATVHGAVVTIVLACAVVALTWRELVFSMKTEVVEKLFVNSTISPTVNMTFDVVFDRIPCALLSIDVEDESGTPQENLRHDVTGTRLALDGRPIVGGVRHVLGNTLKEVIAQEEAKDKEEKEEAQALAAQERHKDSQEVKDCNCYGAGDEGECCRTCQDVRDAYRRKKWKFDVAEVPECRRKFSENDRKADVDVRLLSDTKVDPTPATEGCRLAGSIEVLRTKGNFHFAPGYELHRQRNSMSVLERIQVAFESFNTTHTINTLTFGNLPPAGRAPPQHMVASTLLGGHHKTVQDTHAMHQYYLQLVPTVYRLSNGETVHSTQYSATEHLRHVYTVSSQGLPGVYFYYEISPIQALVEERQRGLLAFLTGVCGVVGGVYSVLGLVNTGIDGFLRRSGKHRSR